MQALEEIYDCDQVIVREQQDLKSAEKPYNKNKVELGHQVNLGGFISDSKNQNSAGRGISGRFGRTRTNLQRN